MADHSGHHSKGILPFHVDPDYQRELPPDFYLDIAWYYNTLENLPDAANKLLRRIRSVMLDQLPWKCDSKIVWNDLGDNYYPRFLRNVVCMNEKCWFGHFKCRPRAFTVNVLKRIRDSCKDGLDDREWVFEERAVTFCCECVER